MKASSKEAHSQQGRIPMDRLHHGLSHDGAINVYQLTRGPKQTKYSAKEEKEVRRVMVFPPVR